MRGTSLYDAKSDPNDILTKNWDQIRKTIRYISTHGRSMEEARCKDPARPGPRGADLPDPKVHVENSVLACFHTQVNVFFVKVGAMHEEWSFVQVGNQGSGSGVQTPEEGGISRLRQKVQKMSKLTPPLEAGMGGEILVVRPLDPPLVGIPPPSEPVSSKSCKILRKAPFQLIHSSTDELFGNLIRTTDTLPGIHLSVIGCASKLFAGIFGTNGPFFA